MSNDDNLHESEGFGQQFYHRVTRLYPCVDDVRKLPHCWSPEAKAFPIGLSQTKLRCYFRRNERRDQDNDKMAAAVRSDNFIPPACLLYYFEMKIISKGSTGFMGIGLSSSDVQLIKLPGWEDKSYGYHGDDGDKFSGSGQGKRYGPTFTTGDIVGCGYNLIEGNCFFTKNGINLGIAFKDMNRGTLLYPTVGLKTAGEEIQVNFGQEQFKYDIEQDLRSLMKNMTLNISNYPISDFTNWQTTLHKIIQSWLVHNSYPRAAEVFSRSTRIEFKENMKQLQQRFEIQQLVLSGRISDAIKLTNSLIPTLMQSKPDLLFKLKCRQFVELIGGSETDYESNLNGINFDGLMSSPTNGFATMDTSNGTAESKKFQNNLSTNGCSNNTKSISKTAATGANIDPTPVNNQSLSSASSSASSSQELMDIDHPNPLAPPNLSAARRASDRVEVTNNSNNNNDIPSSASVSSRSSSNDILAGLSTTESQSLTTCAGHLASNQNSQQHNSDNHSSDPLATSVTKQHQIVAMETNGSSGGISDRGIVIDEDIDMSDKEEYKFVKLLKYARDLSEFAGHLRMRSGNNSNDKLFEDTIGLLAFKDLKNSRFGWQLDESEREPIAQLLNNSIKKADLGESYRTPLEEVVAHLNSLVRLNDSQGKWLIDNLQY